MSFLFKRTPRTPQELVRCLNEALGKLPNPESGKKAQDECARYLKAMKTVLHGDEENEPVPDQIAMLAQEIYASDCLVSLVSNLGQLDFDSRKDVAIIFSTLLRRKLSNKSPTVDYLVQKQAILALLVRGQETPEIGLVCGSILRDCIKFEVINALILHHAYFWNYFNYVQNDIFEIATDAFATLHDLLTVHKKLVSEFLSQNYEPFTKSINRLIASTSYVTKRQSVRLLSELVLTKSNQGFLNKYFDDTTNLKLIMMLLSDKAKNLQIEAFHIFKFFVAKPKKSQKVLDILIKNKENFIEFFEKFDLSYANDPNLLEEKDYILNEIKNLPDIERVP